MCMGVGVGVCMSVCVCEVGQLVSQLINQLINCSFDQWINQLEVRQVKQLLGMKLYTQLQDTWSSNIRSVILHLSYMNKRFKTLSQSNLLDSTQSSTLIQLRDNAKY